MPGFRALIGALAAAACAAAFAACGGDDEGGPIPPEQGNQLIDQLDEIEAAVEAGDCDRAQELAVVLNQNVNTLPLGDDPELREALVTASGNLETLTEDPEQCTPAGATGETGTVPTTETTTTTTEPTTTTTTEEPEEDEEGGGPPEEPPGGGNGNPGGGNNGNGSGDDDSSGGIGSDG